MYKLAVARGKGGVYPQYPQDKGNNVWINGGEGNLSFWCVCASIREMAKDDITMVSYTFPD